MRDPLVRRAKLGLLLLVVTQATWWLLTELASGSAEANERVRTLEARVERLHLVTTADLRHVEDELVVAGVFERVDDNTGLPPMVKAAERDTSD